jgi:Rod binding domain-containing protein
MKMTNITNLGSLPTRDLGDDIPNIGTSPERIKQKGVPTHLEEAETVAKQFESLFMDQIVKGMRKTVPTEESSNAMGIYTDMLDGEHAKAMTEAREFGIKQMILDWMKTADPKLQTEAKPVQLTTLRNSARRFLE